MAAKARLDGDILSLGGPSYLHVLERIHALFEPRSYLEIGTQFGHTLRLARCPSVAVDPSFHLTPDLLVGRPELQLFEVTSDAFFAANDPRRLFGRRVDLAFLDGMHAFDFLLRDFINTERSCRPGSMIVMHDCLPLDPWMTRPYSQIHETAETPFPNHWTGDVWKMVPVLRATRPDLRLTVLDAQGTGLVVARGLDPFSPVLGERIDRLVAEWAPVQLRDYGMARLLADARPVGAEDWLAQLRPASLRGRVRRKVGSAMIRARMAGEAVGRRLKPAAVA